jgi:hypothetical protein
MRQRKLFLLFPFFSSYLGYINGIQLAKLGLLIDRTSSIYLNVRLKSFHIKIRVPVKWETKQKRITTKRNEIRRNETEYVNWETKQKRNTTKRNEIRRNETKSVNWETKRNRICKLRNETKRNERRSFNEF